MSSNGNDIYNLADGWLELESDPGLFTLLLEDMGVPDVQVGFKLSRPGLLNLGY